jgi:hypothetical protein
VTEENYDVVTKAKHYNVHPSGIEVMDIVKHETFVRGNIIKYVLRAPYKGDELQDLLKAQEYLAIEIETIRAAQLPAKKRAKRKRSLWPLFSR